MYCTRCGTLLTEGAVYCQGCGQPVHAAPTAATLDAAATPVEVPLISMEAPPVSTSQPPLHFYAGFWLRLIAFLIDKVVLTIAFGIIVAAVVAALGIDLSHMLRRNPYPDGTNVTSSLAAFQQVWEYRQQIHVFPGAFVMAIVAAIGASLLASWLYYAWMESSASQGTLGKMMLGLIVTDLQGQRVSFGRASGRFFARLMTNLVPFFIGYFMAGFTEKKQALHDILAGCLVLRRN